MGHLFSLLGVRVGCIQNSMEPDARRDAYGCDISYGTAAEFGFDYLRDNGLAFSAAEQVQRDHYYCIVDEIDSVLIDEARTPLIISGPVEEERVAPYRELCGSIQRLTELQLQICNNLMVEARELLDKNAADERAFLKLFTVRMGMPKHRQLSKILETGAIEKRLERLEGEMASDMRRDEKLQLKETLYFTVDERHNSADLTELGRKTLYPDNPDAFVFPDLAGIFSELEHNEKLAPQEKQALKNFHSEQAATIGERIHCIGQLIRAFTLFERDQHYIVHGGQILIVDQNTGRAMAGRRWSDGLHQAVEAKEGLEIQKETRTFATITVQNYFRLYEKLAGMTGTAETEAQEFHDIYHLAVVVVPTHMTCIRRDEDDAVYKTRREKYAAIIADVEEAYGRGQPILVGTTSVEASELLSKMLQMKKLPHTVLNAKFHETEAKIIAKAGSIGAITIATNMAGRGTDIRLAEGVCDRGGLRVIGTERHESRRIDRQLRGRCARQGDPGSSKFYISLEDDLMRLFASRGPIAALLDRTFREGDVLAHPLLSRSIASAQKKVEQQNYAVRKRLLQYDDVLNAQREVIYTLRNGVLHGEKPKDIIEELLTDHLSEILAFDAANEQDLEEAVQNLQILFPMEISADDLRSRGAGERVALLLERIWTAYAVKEEVEDSATIQHLERFILLRAIDRHWQMHLTEMDELRHSVSLRSYAQKNPLYEYKNEAFARFEQLMRSVRRDVAFSLFRSASSLENVQKILRTIRPSMENSGDESENLQNPQKTVHLRPSHGVRNFSAPSSPAGRNELCPCGSGKKYKKCCGTGK
ncbi:MAG: SEC-C domain-containing protein [Puniceicoccales bacterium]|jgi:preprotein translocase subunit SecA|nr:SEC-C domain-containing protein [Puniceicoccales bacterium]